MFLEIITQQYGKDEEFFLNPGYFSSGKLMKDDDDEVFELSDFRPTVNNMKVYVLLNSHSIKYEQEIIDALKFIWGCNLIPDKDDPPAINPNFRAFALVVSDLQVDGFYRLGIKVEGFWRTIIRTKKKGTVYEKGFGEDREGEASV
jgi:hypothetical protein